MSRRKSVNVTDISRIDGIQYHEAYVAFICLNCLSINYERIGLTLISPNQAYEQCIWECKSCGFIHSKESDIPFKNWDSAHKDSESKPAEYFWRGFFRVATEHPESYWKPCNVCGRILPFSAFSRHAKWGPLERQMECRACKGAINAVLNPKRTSQQLHEASVKRRVADLLLETENEPIDIDDLFKRFKGRCFKTRQKLVKKNRNTWAIDHILPSKWLYPLTKENAALLSKGANENKRDMWPSKFYTNSELIELAKITGANLSLLTRSTPIINKKIDVNKGVDKYLQVREKSNLKKRINEIQKIIRFYKLERKLNKQNRRLLGFS